MKYLLLLLSAVLLFWSGTVTLAAETGVRPADLRCEYLVNPLGLDIKQPRLSWILESAQRNQAQTAYQVLVATTEDLLKQDKGDLWDSGKVASDDSIAIVYAGQPLAGHQRCCWKVKVWDRNGKPSPWSSPALWSMGVLDAREWDAAAWIGYDKPREKASPEADFDGAKWIWHAADKGPNKPKGHRLFLTTLALPEGAKVEKAELLVVADDAFKFTINGRDVANGTSWKEPKQVEVQGHLKPGKNTLRVEVENAAPSPAGLLVKLTVKIAGGQTLTLVSDASWKSLGQPGANWHNRTIDLDPLPAAEVIAAYGDQPWGKLTYAPLRLYPPVMLRTSFTLTKPVCRATLYPTALGLVDVYVNGKRVSEDRFNPGWTDYTKRVYYRAYDVTGLVHSGANALGAILADGWYSGYVGFGGQRDHYGKKPRFRGLLHLDYADGTCATIATGPDWKASTGPTLEGDFLMGETFDARKVVPGWDGPDFNDSGWDKVVTGAEMKPRVQHHPGPAVDPCGEFTAQKITEPAKGAMSSTWAATSPAWPVSRWKESRARKSPCASPSGSIPTAPSTPPTCGVPGVPTRTSAAARESRCGSRVSPSTASSMSRSPVWRNRRSRIPSPASP